MIKHVHQHSTFFHCLARRPCFFILQALAEGPLVHEHLLADTKLENGQLSDALHRMVVLGLIESFPHRTLNRRGGKNWQYRLARGTVVTEDAIEFNIGGLPISIGRYLKEQSEFVKVGDTVIRYSERRGYDSVRVAIAGTERVDRFDRQGRPKFKPAIITGILHVVATCPWKAMVEFDCGHSAEIESRLPRAIGDRANCCQCCQVSEPHPAIVEFLQRGVA